MGRTLRILILAAVAASTAACGGSSSSSNSASLRSGDVAVVGDIHITKQQLDHQIKLEVRAMQVGSQSCTGGSQGQEDCKNKSTKVPKVGTSQYTTTIVQPVVAYLVTQAQVQNIAKALHVSVTAAQLKTQVTQAVAQYYGGNKAKYQADLKKYADFTGVPGFGEYTGYVSCDLAIVGLKAAGKNPTRQGWVDGIRNTNGGIYDNAGLTCSPRNFSTANFGKVATETCGWYVVVKDGKWKVLFGGKPLKGKLVGDPALIKQYQSSAGTGVTTTSAAPAS